VNPRRVYGDWSSRYLRGWGSILTLDGLEARHHGAVASSGKKATDIALVVDADEHKLDHGGRGVCLPKRTAWDVDSSLQLSLETSL
jgi:hypothetical protein